VDTVGHLPIISVTHDEAVEPKGKKGVKKKKKRGGKRKSWWRRKEKKRKGGGGENDRRAVDHHSRAFSLSFLVCNGFVILSRGRGKKEKGKAFCRGGKKKRRREESISSQPFMHDS